MIWKELIRIVVSTPQTGSFLHGIPWPSNLWDGPKIGFLMKQEGRRGGGKVSDLEGTVH
jgi:hypothetical protein